MILGDKPRLTRRFGSGWTADSLQRVICDWITSKEITEKYLIGIRSEAYKKTQPNCKIENERKQKTSQVTAKLRGRERNRVPPTS